MTVTVTATGARRADVEEGGRPGGFGSLGSILHLLALVWAAGIATYPLTDNSFFTHLATGRLILDERSVPSSDPYTFTASGEPWTVQSWLASVAYAGAERLGGDIGLRLLVLVVFLVAMTVLWHLTRPARSIIGRLLVLSLALVIVTELWGERPYMLGVIGLGLVWLAFDGRVGPWLLVPYLWVWVNTHGSFVLAAALVVLVAFGAAVDRRRDGGSWSLRPIDRTVGAAVLGGTILGAISPVGPKLLWFPLTAVTRSDVFAEIIEWRSPAFQSVAERSFLVLLALTLFLLVRQPSFRLAVPTIAFAVAALTAQRNVVMATVVLVAVACEVMPPLGALRATTRPPLGRPLTVLVCALLTLVVAVALVSPVHGFGGYPARALAWSAEYGIDGRVAHQVLAGNLIEVLDGPEAAVFIDDRVDMFPEQVFADYLALRNGSPEWQRILDRYDIDVVIWERDAALASLVSTSDAWQAVYSDATWIVVRRR